MPTWPPTPRPPSATSTSGPAPRSRPGRARRSRNGWPSSGVSRRRWVCARRCSRAPSPARWASRSPSRATRSPPWAGGSTSSCARPPPSWARRWCCAMVTRPDRPWKRPFATSRSGWWPTSQPGTTRISWGRTSSSRRCSPATPCSTSRPNTRPRAGCASPSCCTKVACPTTCSSCWWGPGRWAPPW